MDRWEDVDDGITPVQRSKGRVARMGIAGFVQAAVTASEQSAACDPPQPGIVVVGSKREQRAAAARQAMPPPATAARPAAVAAATTEGARAAGNAAAAAPVLPRPAVPAGSLPPPAGTLLLVHKAGTLVQHISITEVMTVFGRLPCNDIILDHASTSRQHAALTFRQLQQKQEEGQQQQQSGISAVLCDLGSAHGTFVQGRRITRGQLCPLAVGDVFTFGASTRSYSVQMPTATDALCEKSVTKKRSRVTFAEDGAVNCDLDTAVAAGGDGSHKTKKFGQVAGHSASQQSTSGVGPQAVCDGDPGPGRFAHLLDSKVTVLKARPVPRLMQQQTTVDGGLQQQHQQQRAADKEITAVGATAAAPCTAAVNEQMIQQKQQWNHDPQHNTSNTRAAESGDATSAEHKQQQSTSSAPPAAAAGVVRSWSGGQSRALLPPQLARRNSSLQQEKLSPGGGGSSLYDQLPKAAAPCKAAQQCPE